MKKWIILFIVLLLFVTACNFPLFNPVGPVQTESPTSETLTLTSTLSQGPDQATRTVTPSQQSVTATVTETVTPTITVTPSDPAQALGQPVWNNPLDNGQSFGLGSSGYSDDYSSIYVSGSRMILTSHLASAGWKSWRLTDRYLANYYLEGTFMASACSGLDSYGLVYRVPDYSSGFGYYFGISCDGRYSLLRWDSNGSTYIVPWTTNPEINVGSNQTNRIGVMVNGAIYSLYVNGKKLQDVNDGSFMTDTKLGIFIAAFETPDFTVSLDQINQWEIP